ncbi:MAG: hypothetical protein ACE5HL_03050 [Terriglobia bacterium]
MVNGVFSFHVMREACLARQAEGWRQFVKSYTPLAGHLLQHYFPRLEHRALLAEIFRHAKMNTAQFWQGFAGTSEKEFLLHIRRFVMEGARAARGARPETPLTPQVFWAVLQEFPLLQRELLLLSFHGYTPEELHPVLKFEPETTRTVTEQARGKLRAQLGAAVGPDFERHDHDALFAAIEESHGEKCLPDKTYGRIVDGQISWRDRDAAEQHIEGCLHCVNRFAEFREILYYHRTLPPPEDSTLAPIAVALGLPVQEPARRKKRPWWQRLLGG